LKAFGIFAQIINLSYLIKVRRKLKDEHCCSDSPIMSLVNKLIPPSTVVHWALEASRPGCHSRSKQCWQGLWGPDVAGLPSQAS